MTSQIVLKRIQRSYSEAEDASVDEVFIPREGWVKSPLQSLTRDNLEYLKRLGAEMVNLQVFMEDGRVVNPDYSIPSLLRSF